VACSKQQHLKPQFRQFMTSSQLRAVSASACMCYLMTLTFVVDIVGHNAGKVTVSKLVLCLARH